MFIIAFSIPKHIYIYILSTLYRYAPINHNYSTNRDWKNDDDVYISRILYISSLELKYAPTTLG